MKPPIQLLKEELARHEYDLEWEDFKHAHWNPRSKIVIEWRIQKRTIKKMIRLYKHSIKLLEK